MSTNDLTNSPVTDRILAQNYETGSERIDRLVGAVVLASVVAHSHDYGQAVNFTLNYVDKLEKAGILAECCPFLVREEARSMVGFAFASIRAPAAAVNRPKLVLVSS
jgi:hypothetical protein